MRRARQGAPAALRAGRRWSALLAGLALAGCTLGGPPPPAATTPTGASGSTTTAGPEASGGSAAGPSTTPGPAPIDACVSSAIATLGPTGQLGQLFMVGLQPATAPAGLDRAIREHHLGSVVYLGGWTGGVNQVSPVSAHLQRAETGRVGLFVAADQEGGSVQQLRGTGFSRLPTALVQAGQSPERLQADAATLARELRSAGVNVDLAPVADTVPAGREAANAPIGAYSRQFGSEPAVVSRSVTAVVTGLQAAGVVATVKHFPGLGRVRGNTDVTAVGIDDEVADAADPHLEPFAAGIRAGVGMVMVSSARYPRLDPANQAMFSRAVVTDLLRGRLGWQGVVVTDDVGAAKAVASVPVGERAVRFLAAGGDLVLTADPAQLPTMLAAVQARAATDPAFAASVRDSVARVVALKARFGLVRCG